MSYTVPMEKNGHILVVDDDTRLRRLLKKYLGDNNFDVSEASDAVQAVELLGLFFFDLVIMDVMMPGKTGLEFTQEMREKGYKVPILMLTAMGDTSDRIRGLEMGADDYLSKPFEPRELILRIKSILKRSQTVSPSAEIFFGACRYVPQKGILFKNDQPISLTQTDLTILKALCAKIGDSVSREELGDALETDNLRSVDVQITRLRKKIEDENHPPCIRTVRGKGYVLVPQ